MKFELVRGMCYFECNMNGEIGMAIALNWLAISRLNWMQTESKDISVAIFAAKLNIFTILWYSKTGMAKFKI